jgi:hypothetical protein
LRRGEKAANRRKSPGCSDLPAGENLRVFLCTPRKEESVDLIREEYLAVLRAAQQDQRRSSAAPVAEQPRDYAPAPRPGEGA